MYMALLSFDLEGLHAIKLKIIHSLFVLRRLWRMGNVFFCCFDGSAFGGNALEVFAESVEFVQLPSSESGEIILRHYFSALSHNIPSGIFCTTVNFTFDGYLVPRTLKYRDKDKGMVFELYITPLQCQGTCNKHTFELDHCMALTRPNSLSNTGFFSLWL